MKKIRKKDEAIINPLIGNPTNKQTEKELGNQSSKLPRVLTMTRSIEPIPLSEISHFALIPDFIVETTAEKPLVIRTPNGNFCIDGWNMVNEAQAEGLTELTCEIDEIADHSDTELCLRKSGIRSVTRGGTYVYAEMVRNARDLFVILQSSKNDLRIFGHGGNRFGKGFTNNREDDARHILSIKLGKDRDTINSYLNHAIYLSDDALQYLIEQTAPKEFFVKVQTKKRAEITRQLGSDNPSVPFITKSISEFILEEFKDFLSAKEKKENAHLITTAVSTELENLVDDSEHDLADVDNENIPQENNSTDGGIYYQQDATKPITFESIKQEVSNVSKRIADDVIKNVDLIEIKKRLEEELRTIAVILNKINFLGNAK